MSLDPGSMPGGGARGQNLGHLYFGSKFWFKFHWWCISHEPMIRSHSYFNHRYTWIFSSPEPKAHKVS